MKVPTEPTDSKIIREHEHCCFNRSDGHFCHSLMVDFEGAYASLRPFNSANTVDIEAVAERMNDTYKDYEIKLVESDFSAPLIVLNSFWENPSAREPYVCDLFERNFPESQSRYVYGLPVNQVYHINQYGEKIYHTADYADIIVQSRIDNKKMWRSVGTSKLRKPWATFSDQGKIKAWNFVKDKDKK